MQEPWCISVRPIRIRPSASLFAGHACGVITECSRQPSLQLLAYASNGLPSSPAATLHCIFFWMNVLLARFFFHSRSIKNWNNTCIRPMFYTKNPELRRSLNRIRYRFRHSSFQSTHSQSRNKRRGEPGKAYVGRRRSAACGGAIWVIG